MKRSPVNTNNDTGVIRPQGQPIENISVLNKGLTLFQSACNTQHRKNTPS